MVNMSTRAFNKLMAERAGQAPAPSSVSPRKPKAEKVVSSSPELNATERAYRDLLDQLVLAGDVRRYWVQAVTLRLADDCRYTPDFLAELADGGQAFVEVKGFLRDDADVKFKMAVATFPQFAFVMVAKGKKGEGWRIVKSTRGVDARQLIGVRTAGPRGRAVTK